MAVINNPVIGIMECPSCGGDSTVHQSKRGQIRSLYTRCPECGIDQRNGPAIQAKIFYGARWRKGMEPDRPANVKDQIMELMPEPVSTLGLDGKGSPNEPEALPKKRRGHIPLLIAVGLGVAAIIV